LAVAAGTDPGDPWSRSLPVPPAVPIATSGRARIGFADLTDEPVDDATRASYAHALVVLAATGAELVPVDISPLRAAGDLLYDGPWVAERLTELEPWIDAHPTSLLPVTATVLASGRTKLAVDAFRGFHRLAELVAELEPTWSAVDAIVLPTVASTPTVAETLADPHRMNTRMGQYTMFANLLDLAAIAAPASFDQGTGRPAGVTFYAPAGQDGRLASLAAQFQDATGLLAGSTQYPVRLAAMGEPSEADVLVAVVGAHRSGQPLNGQLVALGARSVAITLTAAAYRLFALPTSSIDPIQRPGLVRVNENGESIEVELFGLPVDALGRFLLTIPAPLGLGLIELVDGTRVTGFLCEAVAIEGALDISDYKSWVNFVAEGPRT
jgi:allophanate hydrolase